MKLLAILSARSIWLVPTSYLNPGGLYTRPALAALAQRYDFKRFSEPTPGDTPQKGIVFEDGAFEKSDGTVIAVNLSIHDDGFVAETRSSTKDASLFLDDVLSWVTAEFGFLRQTELGNRRIYASTVHVKLEKPLIVVNDALSTFLQLLSTSVATEQSGPLDLASLSFGSDPVRAAQPLAFRFERVVGTAFEDGIFFSFAPCETEEHLKLLNALEKTTSR